MSVRHYLDHASTSPLRPEAAEALARWIDAGGAHGDPSRLHSEALGARHLIETSREQVASLLGVASRQIVFTSGATEAVAAAVFGAVRRRGSGHVVCATVEHSCVRQSVERWASSITWVGVDATGRVDPAEVIDAVSDDTSLVCLQWANHEVGTTQPVAEVVASCRQRGTSTLVDAATAAGHVEVDLTRVPADLVAISGHKLGALPGTGVLVVRRGLRIEPLVLGGDQERARRAGMEPVPGIVSLGAVAGALSAGLLHAELADQATLGAALRDGLDALEGVRLIGHPHERTPHLVGVTIDGIEPQAIVLGLDRAGVAVHSGSACASEGLEPSPVLEAMGVDAHRSLRFSLGWSSTRADVDAALSALPDLLSRLRALS